MAATKFWPISGTGSYLPEDNQQILIQGTVGTTGIDGVSIGAIAAINAIGSTNVKITELGMWVASAGLGSIVFTGTYSGATGNRQVHYYNGQKPAFGLDGPISAILVSAASPSALTVIDNSGKTGSFPAGSLKQGAIYPIQINTVVSTAIGDFIGLSEY